MQVKLRLSDTLLIWFLVAGILCALAWLGVHESWNKEGAEPKPKCNGCDTVVLPYKQVNELEWRALTAHGQVCEVFGHTRLCLK